MGSGLGSLGEGGIAAGDDVTEAQLQLLIGGGLHPVTGAALGTAYYRFATRQDRAAQRIAALPADLPQQDRAAAVRQIQTQEAARGARRAVAGFDYTFSPPKSVSVLWGLADAGTQALLAQAHHAAVADVLDFMEREVAATRSGLATRDGAVAQVDVTGVLATAFDHYDSRAGDPQLHTHVVVSNKVMSVFDGRWRSLDSRPMHAATVAISEHYNAVLADRITRLFGAGWEQRDRGRNRNPAWEVQGVGEALVREFSSRSGDIDAEKDRLVADYAARHGRQPSARTVIKLRQQATLATRPDKQLRSLAELCAGWRGRARHLLGADPATWAGGVLAAGDGLVLRADDIPLDVIDRLGTSVVAAVGEKRSTWRRWNLHAEASRQTMGWRFAAALDREAVVGMVVDAAERASLRLTPDELAAPAGFQRSDGSSVFRPKRMAVFSSEALLEAEERLLARSRNRAAPRLAPCAAEQAMSAASGGRVLSPDQAEALASVAGSGRQVDVLVGPAGAGKTTALAALRAAWERERGPGSVVGLAPSATAAAVLGQDLSIATENTAKWLADHDRGGAGFHDGQLVIVDEASLAGTFTLDRITGLAADAGAKVLLVGDWAQLQSVDAGGAFQLLVSDRDDAPELTDVHRFRADWEKLASLELRHGRPAALDAYQTRGRVLGGHTDDMVEAAYQAWRADTAAGRASLLIADSAATVRDLNQRARHERITAGQVDPTSEAALGDGSRCSRGDLVITRLNDRRLVAGRTGWVRNGDRWTVLRTHPDGAVTIRRAGYTRGASVTLPAPYAAESLDLGYAVTAHRAQGVTVDTSHVVVSPSTTRENLYVALTRGRDANLAYVATDRPDDAHTAPHPSDREDATARDVLTGVLRNQGAEPSAHQAIQIEHEAWNNTAQLAAEYETLAAAAMEDRWAGLIRRCGLPPNQTEAALASQAFGPLAAGLRRAETLGWEPDAELPRLAAARPLDDAADPAAVLHARLGKVLDRLERAPARRRQPDFIAGLIPKATGPMPAAFQQALDQREAALRRRAAEVLDRAAAAGEAWLAGLGPRPQSQPGGHRWDRAALAAAAYRDRHQVTGPDLLGSAAASAVQQCDAARVRRLLADRGNTPAPPESHRRPAPAASRPLGL
jgi:conjugative relaxase-like TrwC/TraI family protein